MFLRQMIFLTNLNKFSTKKRTKMKKLLILFIPLIFLVSCNYEKSTAEVEQGKTERNQSNLMEKQPPVQLEWSLERKNINKRTNLWNDVNKVSFIYLVSYGHVMSFFTIKGKVSSVNSQITNPEQLAISRKGINGGHEYINGVLSSPAEDGSYGSNGDGIFFFTTDGTYVEWAGEYMLCDKPLKITTPISLTRTIKDKK